MGKSLLSNPRLVRKQQNADKNRKKTVYVKIRQSIEKEKLRLILKTVHPDIDNLYFPRQDKPRYVFVVCKNDESAVKNVYKAIKGYRNEEAGILYLQPKLPQPSITPQKNSKQGKISQTKFKKGRNPKQATTDYRKDKSPKVPNTSNPSTRRNTIDPSKLVIANLPKELTEEMVHNIIPTCSKITMFKTAMRPLLLEFSTPDEAYQAFEIISKTPINGIKLQVKYHRIPIPTTKSTTTTAK